MAELVSEYIKRQLKEKEMRDKRNSGEEKRFTITLSEYDYLRLAYIAKKLGLKRSTLSRNLIMQALTDAEVIMGLQEYDDIDGCKTDILTDYGFYINGMSTEGDSEEQDSDDDESDVPKRRGVPRGGPNK